MEGILIMTNGGGIVSGRHMSNLGRCILPWTPEGAQAWSFGNTTSATRAGVGGEKKIMKV